jgi:hypothetical protein
MPYCDRFGASPIEETASANETGGGGKCRRPSPSATTASSFRRPPAASALLADLKTLRNQTSGKRTLGYHPKV